MDKSWKTFAASLMVGLPGAIEAIMDAIAAGQLTGKKGMQLVGSIGIILLGYYAKDKNVTGGSVKQ
jgi:hypothetical protein